MEKSLIYALPMNEWLWLAGLGITILVVLYVVERLIRVLRRG